MVTPKIVSRFNEESHLGTATSRKISGGPLYPAHEVKEMLADGNTVAIKAWTEKCAKDIQKLELEESDLRELLQIAVQSGNFRGAEWCDQKPNGPLAACDAYALERKEYIRHAHKEMNMEYYIKFAISKSGKVLLVASCHLPEQR